MPTTIDRSQPSGAFGASESALLAQSFVAAAARLDSLEVYYDLTSGPPITFRVLVTTVAPQGVGYHPVAVLFESAPVTATLDAGFDFKALHVDTNHLVLTPGASYAIVIDTITDANGGAPSNLSFSFAHYAAGGIDYPDGHATVAVVSGSRANTFAATWQSPTGPGQTNTDMAFKLVFSPLAQTINGTKGKDLIDGTHTPTGQPLPGVDSDNIFGLKGNDKLFGLGGDDQLSGGKGKDQLTGGDGKDGFLFDVGIKNNPADKIMDFNPVDDTILLALAKFKALAPGVLSDAAFRDIGEASSPDAHVIYKASGKLLYDKNGGSSDDAIAFAKVIGAPDLSAADFLVV